MEFTETGKLVYERTYSRTKPDGTKETWPETVRRCIDGNLALVPERYHLPGEREQLVQLTEEKKILPAGRHLWASNVKGAQHLFNCWVSGWTERPSEHFEFTFLRLMEGGGVGANYSNSNFVHYPPVQHPHRVHIVCDPSHADYEKMEAAGLLSDTYDSGWLGAYPIEDSREGWAAALVDLIDTYHRPDTVHFDRVYDVTRVRPAGSRLHTFGGTASGPAPLGVMLQRVGEVLDGCVGRPLDGISAMEMDHALAECVVSGGVRRSARMAMMHWSDPQIFEFIDIKQASGSHWTTNISVEVDAEFWELINGNPDLPQSSEMHAEDVLAAIADGMVHNGEPGFWDSSLSNEDEPNRVVCTNPCGEITLEPWEPCNLGHINLAAFVREDGTVDLPEIERAHTLMTRFLIRATFAPVNDPKSREVLDRNRRIGVGHLGVASYLAMRGIRYTDAAGHAGNLRHWARIVNEAATDYARELRIPVPVKSRTVAPTGTIAKMPGVSEGIHPIFSRYFIRRIRFSAVDPDQRATVERYQADGYMVEVDQYDSSGNTVVVSIPTKDTLVQAVEDLGMDPDSIVQGADDLTLSEMLNMQALYQVNWADNAVSFTANIDPNEYTPESVAETIQKFGGVLKGATIFPAKSMPQAPYERITKEDYEAATATAVADGVDEECATGGCPIR
ncbi:ribonucleoside-triphosphate reductase, adenosylcobalamin-dependent [Nocardia cyriacigeorgica]|uniref:ribonucleoside-triphosphate reductase, adenosylcobalamin-dependent n=1 Tax=Nocardia cyriacigeorgica TaxID=135487 RepID=UPI0024570115|nr:ribonucleoside-triphosphate reductase, adenosylcobalamin-dependent [Nocardia cyriacigeorgica]